jgi:hypothetical protein
VTLQTLALALDMPLAVEGASAVALVSAPLASNSTDATSGLPPLTKAQVHYWREHCGVLAQAGTTGVPNEEAFPPELRPTHPTLRAMAERGIVSRRGRAWHLTWPWYTRLSELRQTAMDTPSCG